MGPATAVRARLGAGITPEALIGLLAVVLLALLARMAASAGPPFVSEVTIGVVLGLLLGSMRPVRGPMRAGIRFAAGTVLRLGIVLLGAGFVVGDIADIGIGAVLLIVLAICLALGTVTVLGRAAGLPRRLVILIAVGTAICGNTAIVATAPVIEADERETSFAVGVITLFGVLAVLLYPFIGHALGLADQVFGLWAGVAVNDTSQVAATGLAYSVAAAKTATAVKLTRNLALGPLVVVVGALARRSAARMGPDGNRAATAAPRRTALVPGFVIAFVVVAAANAVGLIPAAVSSVLLDAARFLILMALVAIGLNTDIRALRALGPRPVYVGLGASAALAVVALALARVIAA